MSSVRVAAGIAVALLVSLSISLSSTSFVLAAGEWLTNGDFENSSSGWVVSGTTDESCTPRSGSGVMGLSLNNGPAQLRQDVASLPPGFYSLSADMRAISGTAIVTTSVRSGSTGIAAGLSSSAGSSWTTQSRQFEIPPGLPGVTLSISIPAAQNVIVCLDNISLTGPEGSSLPTATPAPLTATAMPTFTPTAPISTASPSPATGTATPTVTATASPTPAAGTSLSFTNGGFEDGLNGWKKSGGEVSTVSEPRTGGAWSAYFVSTTAATKRLFQEVAIDPSMAYEFAGSIVTDTGVSQAYLRISWYTSTDGTGSSMLDQDSSKISGSSGGFVYLTTGVRTPPIGARSAEVRIVLVPAGAGPAALFADDFTLTASTPSSPAPVVTPPAPDRAEEDEQDAAAAPAIQRTSTGTTTATPQAVTLGVQATGTARPSGTAHSQPDSRDDNGPAIPWTYLAAPVAIAALAGGVLYGRRNRN